jgi:hypothetical protein
MAIGILVGDYFTREFLSNFNMTHTLLIYGKEFFGGKKWPKKSAKFSGIFFFQTHRFLMINALGSQEYRMILFSLFFDKVMS